jgi:cytochrome c peroxidase
MKVFRLSILLLVFIAPFSAAETVFKAGHESLQEWLLADPVAPPDNQNNADRIALGKTLFFDPRLSGDGNMSCATCHSPLFGWSDGLATAKGFQSKVLGRASPTVTNTAYNALQMWDGRKKSLEDQALGPMLSSAEMNVDIGQAIDFLKSSDDYVKAFKKAYPKEGITEVSLAKAIASFERTILSRDSAFDRWVAGDKKAMTKKQIKGFKLFMDPDKGNCEVCHSAPNFTDDGFHNIGLASYGLENPDMGRYAIKPIGILKGAFKTPTLRDIEYTAPYFHDGSANSLRDTVIHYAKGGEVQQDLDPNMKKLDLTDREIDSIVDFMKALSSPREEFVLPILPKN